LKKIFKKFCTFAFNGENDFRPYKHSNQAIYGMSLGSLYYIWGVGGRAATPLQSPEGTPRASEASHCPSVARRHNM